MICSAWLQKGETKRIWIRAPQNAKVKVRIWELAEDGNMQRSLHIPVFYVDKGLWAADIAGLTYDGHILGRADVQGRSLPFVLRYSNPRRILIYATQEGLHPVYKQYDYALNVLASGAMQEVGGGFYVAANIIDTKSLLCIDGKKCATLYTDTSIEALERCLAKVVELQQKRVSLEEALRKCLDQVPPTKIDSFAVAGHIGATVGSKVSSSLKGKIKTGDVVRIKTGDASTVRTSDKTSIKTGDSASIKAKD